jgi:UDP-glucose 4-epimerase
MILVTGGAGYIGSHTVHRLMDQGHKLVVIDNLSTGYRALLPNGVSFIEADVADRALLQKILQMHRIRSVLHFAASIDVAESILQPELYYRNNTVLTQNLVADCLECGVENFVFSSTCAVYGNPEFNPVTEMAATHPFSPYGRSKLMAECILQDMASAAAATGGKMRFVALRYFNVAGARVAGGIGQISNKASAVVKAACQVALGIKPVFLINGTDYATADGTCVRDFIHVDDLAEAHIRAIAYLKNGGESIHLNCGYGRGYSVQEVVEAVERASGASLPTQVAPRRVGDIMEIWADNRLVKEKLGWAPQYDNLDLICQTAFTWEKKLQAQPPQK